MRHKSILSATCAVSLVVFLYLNGTGHAQQPRNKPTIPQADVVQRARFALLIGINNYESPKISRLEGGVNDVKIMREVLVHTFGFQESNIKTLTDTAATRAEIINAFKTSLVENAKQSRNAEIVFYFSGYGYSNGKHTSIIPVDATGTEDIVSGLITDDDINELASELSQFTQNATFIIDSTHAGGISISNRAVTVLNASISYQRAFDMPVGSEKQAHGVFTYYLVQALKRSTPVTTYRDLIEEVVRGVKQTIPSGQDPEASGNIDRIVFGETSRNHESLINISKIRGKFIDLDAGTARGLKVGAIVNFYLRDANEAGARKLAEGIVTQVGPFSATAELKSETAIPEGAQAVVLDQSDDSVLRVSFSPSIAADNRMRTELTSLLKNNPLLSIAETMNTQAGKAQGVEIKLGKLAEVFKDLEPITFFENGKPLPTADKNSDVYYLDDGNGLPLYGFWIKTDGPSVAKQLDSTLQKYARQRSLLRLSNPVSGLNNKVIVKINRVQGETDANGRLNITKETAAPLDEKDNKIHLGEGEGFRIEAENKQNRALYVAVLEIGTDGSISSLYAKPPKESFMRGNGTVRTGVFKALGPSGSGAFKVIVTTEPVDYSFLEQSGVIETGKVSPRSPLPESVAAQAPVTPILDKGKKSAHANYSSDRGVDNDMEWGTVQVNFSVGSEISSSVIQLEQATLRVWDATDGKALLAPRTKALAVSSVLYSPDGKILATSSADNTINLLDASSGDLIRTLNGLSGPVEGLAFSPDGRILSSAGADGKIILWNVNDGRQTYVLEGHIGAVKAIAFSPDGHSLISGGADRTVKFWFIKNGQNYDTLRGHTDEVTSVAISSDGKTIASGSRDRTIKLWEVGADAALRTIPLIPSATATSTEAPASEGHKLAVTAVAFSPDGKTLASGSADNMIKLWETATGKYITTLIGHTGSISTIAFSNDGKTLLSGSADGNLKLWNIATGELQRSINAHAFGVTSVTFSPDGKRIASGSSIGDIASSRLYVISIGINEYQNEAMKLRYAVNDAQEFGAGLEEVGKQTFQNIRKTVLVDGGATKIAVSTVVEKVIAESRPQDTFVFFFAGQGGVGGSETNQFQFVTVEGKNRSDGISALQLKDWSKRIRAGKQLFILDTSQSAKAIKTFILPEKDEKTGDQKTTERHHPTMPGTMPGTQIIEVHDYAAADSGLMIMGIDGEEYDSREFEHGVFTHALLQGLAGNADAGLGDGQVTAKGLEAYLYRSIEQIRLKSKVNIRPAGYAVGGDISLGRSERKPDSTTRGGEEVFDKQEVQLRSFAESKRYALLIATDNYAKDSGFRMLNNPIFDANAIGSILEKNYGFEVKILPDKKQDDILQALRDYKEKEYGPNSELFVFFAGHGAYSNLDVDGLLIASDSLGADKDKWGHTALHHSEIKRLIEDIDCPNVLVVIDSCYSGTFAGWEVGANPRAGDESISNPEYYKRLSGEKDKPVKMFLTSGGKEYVDDGRKGYHSPFAQLLIKALQGPPNKFNAVTFDMISNSVIETPKSTPHWGYLGKDAKGKQFLFIRTK